MEHILGATETHCTLFNVELLTLESHLETLVNRGSNTGSEEHTIVFPCTTSVLWTALFIARLLGAIWGTFYQL